ncbi:MAG TPA: LacI family DNA-binding transcriptional regulator [Telmatospirillum sp.]|nr:LacI family DNA-binding transcriptional regulator [Telmatospirillum sp.]
MSAQDNSTKTYGARISLVDVARHVGVSRATASLVLRESPLVATKTRERVLAGVKELGYIYNRGAANLRAKRTKAVGLVIWEINNPCLAEVSMGMDSVFDASGYVTYLANTTESVERQERFLLRMREQNVDGIIICPAVGTPVDLLDLLAEWQMPYVQILRQVSIRNGDYYVGPDYQLGVEQATEHLIRLGHRRIALIGGEKSHSATIARRTGFFASMERHRFATDLVLKTPATRQAGAETVKMLLDRPDAPTAAICFNDVVAFGVMVGLQQRGLRPGADFAVIGTDDVPEAAMSFPTLTTISTSPRQIGVEAARLLLRRLDSPNLAPERIILPPRLIVRDSCGPVMDPAVSCLSPAG